LFLSGYHFFVFCSDWLNHFFLLQIECLEHFLKVKKVKSSQAREISFRTLRLLGALCRRFAEIIDCRAFGNSEIDLECVVRLNVDRFVVAKSIRTSGLLSFATTKLWAFFWANLC
jgi:hypothetical protein